jgi:hypothetical protein
MSDPKEIFLQPECCASPDTGRMWCEHDAPVDCEDGAPWARYVLVPDGYALVPIEPTDGMTFIGQSMRYESLNSIGAIYKAMIAAAQEN